MDSRPVDTAQTASPRFALYYHIHLVSDSTGETLMNVMKAAIAQFPGVIPVEHFYALVRSDEQMGRVLQAIEDAPGMVLCTIVNPKLRAMLERRCASLGLSCVSILDPLVQAMSREFGQERTGRVGAQRQLDPQYDSRIDALEFAMRFDDGHNMDRLAEADVVLVGVSRTSKTPTCIYLAHRGVKAANVPLVDPARPPAALATLEGPLVVGLTASPDRLVQVRRNRLTSMNDDRQSSYADPEVVRREVLDARRFMERRGWPVIDVSRRSVEETAAQILNHLAEKTDGGAT